MRKQKYVISIQQSKGVNAPLYFEISETKAQKIIDLLNPEIKKRRKQMECIPATLIPFFKEENQE
tara:strand:+ start:264 stop:458 length:195 start_codon:yes stop_codon:yes gene_type:complete